VDIVSDYIIRGHAVAQLVEIVRSTLEGRGSIPDGVIGIFHWRNPSGGRTMALGSTQPVTERVPGIFLRG
jgi:hypothetical protein